MKQINHTIVDNLLLNLFRFRKSLIINEIKERIFYFVSFILFEIIVVCVLLFYFKLDVIGRFSVLGVVIISLGFGILVTVLVPIFNWFRLNKFNYTDEEIRVLSGNLRVQEDRLGNALDLFDANMDSDLYREDLKRRAAYFDDIDFNFGLPKVYWNRLIGLLGSIFFVFGLVGYLSSGIYTTGLSRLVNPVSDYSISGFSFVNISCDTTVFRGEDVLFSWKLEGSSVPEEIFVDVNGVISKISMTGANVNFLVQDIYEDVSVHVYSGDEKSRNLLVDVVDRPKVFVDSVLLEYPTYTNYSEMIYKVEMLNVLPLTSVWYWLRVENGSFLNGYNEVKFTDVADSVSRCFVNVQDLTGHLVAVPVAEYVFVEDMPPRLLVQDSGDFLVIRVTDDFGLNRLIFKGELGRRKFSVSGKAMELVVGRDELLDYGNGCFVVCDNNPKGCCVSSARINVVEELVDVYKSYEFLSEHNETAMSTDNEERLAGIETKLQEVKEFIREVNKEIEIGNNTERKNQLEDLNDFIENERLNSLMEELKELEDKINDSSFEKKLKEIERTTNELIEDLENSLGLLEAYKTELKLQEFGMELDKFGSKLDSLKGEGDLDSWKLSNELSDLLDKGIELDSLMFDELQIENALNEIFNELGDKDDSGDSNNAKKKVEELSKKIAQKLMDLEAGTPVDLDNLRNILENLKWSSYFQEVLVSASADDFDVYKGQLVVKESFFVVEDSLLAMVKRVPLINDKVMKELMVINHGFETYELEYKDASSSAQVVAQRKILTSQNELSVLLDDIINSAQEKMGQPSDGSCNKPGANPKPGKGKLGKMSKDLQSNMKALEKKLGTKGKIGKEGNTGRDGSGNLGEDESKELSELIFLNQESKRILEDLAKEGKLNGIDIRVVKDLQKLLDYQESVLMGEGSFENSSNIQDRINLKLLELEDSINSKEYEHNRSSSIGETGGESGNEELRLYLKKKLGELKLLKSKEILLNMYYEGL